MIKKLFSALLVGSALAGTAAPQHQFLVGKTQVIPPSGWQLVRTEKDSLVFQTKDERQQATVSVMQLAGSTATFEEFKHFCDVRIAGERKFLTDGFIEPNNPTPFTEGDTFGMFYSGGDRKSGRVFSASFSLKQGELVTVYVEGLGVSPSNHLQAFKSFVAGTKFVGGKTKK